ncbi:hypothetical protein [Paucibacter sp. DJ1R-11]|uniref:hypothetical protein n=1 Tax=Paucibacter sp. DJ1R-11 TaxID=2893556 RepID=UPI00398C5E02
MFVHGCFWHGHDCRQGRTPSTNVGYWTSKIEDNRASDARKAQALRDLGWRVFTVWECELKAKSLTASVTNLSAALARAHFKLAN